jgi:hypothetical protein
MEIAAQDSESFERSVAPMAEPVPIPDDEAIARRREATLKRMLATPHMPHGSLRTNGAAKP